MFDPRINEYTPVRCDGCHMLYYTPEFDGSCKECGSEEVKVLTDEEAIKDIKKAILGKPM